MRKRLLYKRGEIFDVALYDNQEGTIVIERCRWKLADTHPSPRYTPIGIVAIPISHSSELYDEGNPCKGKSIIMSLKYMRYDDPDNGGDLQKMCWGENYDYFQGTNPESPINAVAGIYEVSNYYRGEGTNGWYNESYAYAPASYLKGTRCVSNRSLFYYDSPYFPTPYMDDLSFYPTFKIAFADDKLGRTYTDLIVKSRCTVDWHNGPINNSSENGNYPAFCCCLRYRTPGTNPGDWWCPSITELMYLVPYANRINLAIDILNNIYGDGTGYELDLQPGAFSSSTPTKYFANIYGWGPNDGNIARIPRSSNYKIRAFCAV